jgi:hypothetical protein
MNSVRAVALIEDSLKTVRVLLEGKLAIQQDILPKKNNI